MLRLPLQKQTTCAFSAVCVCVFAQAQKSLCHHRWMTSSVPVWDCGDLGLEVCVCVCCFLCNVCVIYHFSHEKRETNTHQLSHSHVSVHRVKVNNQWTCYIFVISILDSSFMSILLCNSGLEKLNLVFAHCSSMFDKRSPVFAAGTVV